MLKNLILILSFTLVSCEQTKPTQKIEKIEEQEQKIQTDLKMDSAEISKILLSKTVNQLVLFDKETFSIPFNYSMKANNRSEMIFLWKIGDLEINSNSDNYFSFAIEDQIEFKDDNLSVGNMHLVWTDDKKAITLAKVKDQLTDIDEIYYSDNQSLIYRKRDIINTLFFEYLNDKKAFAVYLSSNDYFFFSKFNDVSLEQKLELAIEQLSFAKQFFKIKNTKTASGWQDYEKNLNDLNKITIKESYEEIDMAMKSSTVNKFIQLKKLDISLMNLKTDNVKLWKDIQNFYSKKEMRSAENDFPNFENIFGKATVNKIEYIDANSIILFSKDAFDHPFYTTLVKTTIKGKDIILATKNIESSVLSKETSKEMAYFYKTLFNHFGKI